MGNIDSRPVCATHERFATIRALDSNIAHRTSDFEFFSKLLVLLHQKIFSREYLRLKRYSTDIVAAS